MDLVFDLPAGQHTILNIWDWWVKKVHLRLKLHTIAGNVNRGMDYGMNAVDTSHKDLDGAIKDFVQGHMATQNTIQNLSQEFPELCAQTQQ